ncbi:MAG: DMT family transporter [Saccharomonospora viridis]|uniref:DMT(Drug/metabolite transporter) superfamily permease n=2 Tax=Saccharomonospora viridis TaxID=1852 RepID=C7MSL3_SACVD|nr:DMT(drug/metabolite transporter) superfamily permease [Saccharomonospora viridis DSM 43017]KHF42757.1 multidrug transporter [Saccharomonospora viridis]SFO92379.1 Permease of the drug/metabolite transporter (DMT) superfamily [Saccharomonospora viridis]
MTEPPERAPIPRTDATKAALAAAVTMVLWSSAFVGIRAIGEVFSPAPLALLRLAVASVTLTVLIGSSTRRLPPLPRDRTSWLFVASYGVLWLCCYTVALNAAELHLDAGTAALLVNIAPLLVTFGAGVVLAEGFPRPLLLGGSIGMSGIVIIGLGTDGEGDWIGVALCLLAAVLYAAGVLIQKKALDRIDATTITWLGCLIGTAVLLPWTPRLASELATAPTSAVLGAVYLGVFPTAIGFSTWAYALKRTEAGRLSVSTYAVPALSVVLSWVLLAEVPTGYGLVGGVVCLAGVAVSRYRPRRAVTGTNTVAPDTATRPCEPPERQPR